MSAIPILDPSKEIPAYSEGILTGQYTLSEVLRARGKDPREHLSEYQKDVELLRELNLEHILLSTFEKKGNEKNAKTTEEE